MLSKKLSWNVNFLSLLLFALVSLPADPDHIQSLFNTLIRWYFFKKMFAKRSPPAVHCIKKFLNPGQIKNAQVKMERARCHFKASSLTGPPIDVVLGGPGGWAAGGQKEKL